MGRGPDCLTCFLDDRELQWANLTIKMPLPQPLSTAPTNLRALLFSKDIEQWAKLKLKISTSPLYDLPIAPRWRHILEADWSLRPDTPSPLALDRATLQHSLKSAALK